MLCKAWNRVMQSFVLFQDGLVCLSQPSTKRELAHLLNVWMSTADLVKVIGRCNVQPNGSC